MAALVRAARQGQRRLLAWQPALAELVGTGERPADPWQQAQSLCLAAAGVQAPLQQHAWAGAATRWQPPGLLPQQHASAAAAAATFEQRRGMAMKVSGFRKKWKDTPDRILPARNEEIDAPEVRVLFPDSEKPSEIMLLRRALRLAKQQDLDVVMVTPKAEPPVVRLIEWSKVIYEAQKREKTALKQKIAQQRAADPKEVRIGCAIAEHDLEVKMGQARRFLQDGFALRLVVTFKGGSQIALGRDVMLYLIGQLAELAKIKDEKHLQRPMRNYWAVQLMPLAPPPLPGKGHDLPKLAAVAARSAKAAKGAGGADDAADAAADAKSTVGAEAEVVAEPREAAEGGGEQLRREGEQDERAEAARAAQ